jgi:hypothetical protein
LSKTARFADCKRFIADWVLFIDCSRAYDDAKKGNGNDDDCHLIMV